MAWHPKNNWIRWFAKGAGLAIVTGIIMMIPAMLALNLDSMIIKAAYYIASFIAAGFVIERILPGIVK